MEMLESFWANSKYLYKVDFPTFSCLANWFLEIVMLLLNGDFNSASLIRKAVREGFPLKMLLETQIKSFWGFITL